MKYKTITLLLAVFLIAGTLHAQSVTLKQVGKVKIHFNTVLVVRLNGFLYSIDHTGALYKTNLATGEHARLGTGLYKNTRFFFDVRNSLYSIESDGSMNKIDPLSGTWSVVSAIGAWSTVERAIGVGNNFYTIQNGALYHHPTMVESARKQIGGSEFYNVGLLGDTDSTLHSVVGGNLYRINTATGEWIKIGGRVWRTCKTIAVTGNKIYSVETPASLFETSLPDGTKKEIDNTQFKNARFIFADSGKLYVFTIEDDLFEIVIN